MAYQPYIKKSDTELVELPLNASLLDGKSPSYYLNYNNFKNTPTIPTKTSQLTNDSNFLTGLPSRLAEYKTNVENTPIYSGFYYFSNTSDTSAKTAFDNNAQASTWVSAYSDTWAGQIGISYYSDNIAFRRKQGSSTWGDWVGIATKNWVTNAINSAITSTLTKEY